MRRPVPKEQTSETRQPLAHAALRGEMVGHATFLVHPDAEPREEPVAPGPETGIIGRLGDHVRLTNGLGQASAVLTARLDRVE